MVLHQLHKLQISQLYLLSQLFKDIIIIIDAAHFDVHWSWLVSAPVVPVCNGNPKLQLPLNEQTGLRIRSAHSVASYTNSVVCVWCFVVWKWSSIYLSVTHILHFYFYTCNTCGKVLHVVYTCIT